MNALFFGLHVGVLAAQVGELLGDIAGRPAPGLRRRPGWRPWPCSPGLPSCRLPFQFTDLQLHPLTPSGNVRIGPAHTGKRQKVPPICGLQARPCGPGPDLAKQPVLRTGYWPAARGGIYTGIEPDDDFSTSAAIRIWYLMAASGTSYA